MRILALADAPPHRPLPELAAAVQPDLLVLLGDLEPAWTDGLPGLGVPAVGVHGNHDAPGALARLGAQDLHLAVATHGGLTFTGFAGSPRYSDRVHEWTEDEARSLLRLLPAADVLLTHSPPAGVNDEPDDPVHRGSPALRDWVLRERPSWLLHGHTDPQPPGRRTARLGTTRVVHVRGALALDLG